MDKKDFKKITDYIWEIPKSYRADMRVPARFYVSEKMIEKILEDKTVEQAVNVAALPGIINYSLVMPDAHEGYGQCIGGVFATRLSDGIISPGAVGYDINCGVRLMTTNLTGDDLKGKTKKVVDGLFLNIPTGVGSKGSIKLSHRELSDVLTSGTKWAVKNGFGSREEAVLEKALEY